MTAYGPATEAKIKEVVDACAAHGTRSIIALAGVPGTGKSFVAQVAAQRFAGKTYECVKEIQFHQSYSYEEFIEGMRFDEKGAVFIQPGVFTALNQQALDDEKHKYVLLIEELTRANISAVLGELLTYIEHRERRFEMLYSRQPMKVAKNLTILATYNPTDRSAIELDAAILRRLRIIRCPPDTAQLGEMLGGKLPGKVVEKLKTLFDKCAERKDDYEHLMPFGHGIFDGVTQESDLHKLWNERISFLLRRPLVEPSPFLDVVQANYPWIDAAFQVP